MVTEKMTKYNRQLKALRANLRSDVISRRQLGKTFIALAESKGLVNRNDLGKRCREAPSQMSRLMCGNFGEFSVDRLVGYLNSLGADVTIYVKPARGIKGKTRIWSDVK